MRPIVLAASWLHQRPGASLPLSPPTTSHHQPALITVAEVHEALKHWGRSEPDAGPWRGLILLRQAMRRAHTLADARDQVLANAIDQLAADDSQPARLLRLRFAQRLTAEETAQQLHMAASSVFRQQREAIGRLAALIDQQERKERMRRHSALEQRLNDRTYTTLIGVDDQVAQLAARLSAPEAPYLLSIEGLGGIGKTALADALARRLLEDLVFVDLAWVTARQRSLNLGGAIRQERETGVDAAEIISLLLRQLWQDEPVPIALSTEQKLRLLHQRLKQTTHLIVIDNLETVADLENLTPMIRQMANPSKFLLTSRQSLYGEAGVYHHLLRDLSQAHALQLVRQEAAERNVVHLTGASDADLQPIYDTVGGNPLALRLVVGLVQIHPLARVLDGLKQARGLPMVNLYAHIYRQAWHELTQVERQVFLAMLLVAQEHGGDLEQIAATSGLPEELVSPALGNLVTRNLVNAGGGLNQRRYNIHSLTRTFLHEVARWE